MIARFWNARTDPSGFSPAFFMTGKAAAGPEAASKPAEAPRRVRGYMVEAIAADRIGEFMDGWADLHGRALEPNVFLDPAFAVPAYQHLPAVNRPVFVLVHEEQAPQQRGRLIGVTPVMLPRRAFGDSIARGFEHKFASLGMPLFDHHQAVDALELTLDWVAQERPDVVGLLLRDVPKNGPVFSLLRRHASRVGRALALFDERERAILPGGRSDELFSGRSKDLREMRRLRRQMSKHGEVTYRSLRTPAEIREAAEQFMALEDGGWKGARGTSLLAEPSVATFARTMTRLMARKDKISIESLDVGGKPVAMGVVLESNNRAYFWKTAYDEAYARYAPGVQLACELSGRLAARDDIVMTDSCATSGHELMERLWPQRLALADVMVPVARNAGALFESARRRELARRALRAAAKKTFLKAMGRATV